MKRLLPLVIALLACTLLQAQTPLPDNWMRMKVTEDGDTVYVDRIRPAWKTGRSRNSSDKQWRKYYQLVYRFAKVYPYAQASGVLIKEVDSTLVADNLTSRRKEKYIASIQKELFRDFEGALRKMTISQGALLLKLIGRETGLTPYEIIRDYRGGFAAGFWQTVAKLFDNDLKSKYNPSGEDRDTEELVRIWQAGEFPDLYLSVFGQYPPVVEVPDRYKRR